MRRFFALPPVQQPLLVGAPLFLWAADTSGCRREAGSHNEDVHAQI